MISFKNDYSDGGHPKVLEALLRDSKSIEAGYGEDTYSERARQLILERIQRPEALIRFVSGGTQTNLIVINSILKPFESVISASSGHINRHEAGAIEATGHKVDSVDAPDGKLTPERVQVALNRFENCHTVRPALVYLSNTTEVGTVYTKDELQALSQFCSEKGLYLFLDGARLGSALTSPVNDLSLKDIADLTDVFYIGGTKNGALFGEAIVIVNPQLQVDIDFHIKQRGALLAKGRALGVQFATLFEDDLFLELAQMGNDQAQQLAAGIQAKGYGFLTPPVSNQVFPIFPLTLIEHLKREFEFYVWEPVGESKAAIRLVTSWATESADVQKFIDSLE